MIDDLKIRESFGSIDLMHVHSLRYEILRKPHDLNFESAAFPNDTLETTVHVLAVWCKMILGCVSLMPNEFIDTIQLRGMAVRTDYQGRGIGGRLLRAAHNIAVRESKSLWCNARFSAIGFYERHQWKIDGDMFDVPVIGKHAVMRWPK